MRYVSTRGRAPELGFNDVLLEGLARDGGLYVPAEWPRLTEADLRSFAGMPYAEVALRVMRPFVGDAIEERVLREIVSQAYRTFRHHSVAPLFQIGPDEWLLELYHGPTLAFKDVAMQVLARLYDHVLAKRQQRITVVGATSGDTGSAAIEAFRGRKQATIFIMHPHGRTSEVQRRQMTSVLAPNVHNLAIEGTFDDCQALLKGLFNHAHFRDEVGLSGVNSINWARVLPQVVYYVTAAAMLGAYPSSGREVSFTVPTGNFGDVYAGYVARRMGVPIRQLVIATNRNDILARALMTGEHDLRGVEPTISPSMDIQVSSNFERLLFEVYDRDAAQVTKLMTDLATAKRFRLSPEALARIRAVFGAGRVDEDQTLATIRDVYDQTGFQIDPHTAVGVAAAREQPADDAPMVVLGTAHPAKFPDAVFQATGERPVLPAALADLYEREERFDVLPADLERVMAHVRAKLGLAAPAGA